MMKVKLLPENIIKYSYTEEELSDLSKLESFYLIRKLKACTKSQENSFIEVSKINQSNQVFSEEFQIWFSEHEYIMLCSDEKCKEVSVGDYNGQCDFACEYHMKKWNDEFDEEYK